MAKSVNLYNEGFINADRIKEAVYNRIDFKLPEKHWNMISDAFADVWNNEIGLGNWVHEQQIERHIAGELKKKGILIEYNRIETIVKIMSDYIEMTGGYLDNP